MITYIELLNKFKLEYEYINLYEQQLALLFSNGSPWIICVPIRSCFHVNISSVIADVRTAVSYCCIFAGKSQIDMVYFSLSKSQLDDIFVVFGGKILQCSWKMQGRIQEFLIEGAQTLFKKKQGGRTCFGDIWIFAKFLIGLHRVLSIPLFSIWTAHILYIEIW